MKVEIDKDYLGYTLRCSRRSSGPIPLGCATERRVYVNFPLVVKFRGSQRT